MTISEFKPDLISGIKTYLFRVPISNVNPNLCASEQCGKDLASLYAQYRPTVRMEIPQYGVWYGHFTQTAKVAWLEFPNGAMVNCGVLASWWISSAPADAYRYAEMEIKAVIAAKDAEGQQ